MIVQCDTQADSFLLALDVATGKTVWKTDRDELPSWGTPTVVTTPAGPELVTNASNFVRGYDPRTGQGALAARRQLEDHGADADRRRRPHRRRERPRAGAARLRRSARRARRHHAGAGRDDERGRRLEQDRAAARTCRRRSPTAASCTCSATTASSMRTRSQTGEEIYRQRVPHPGSGFSASPVAADGKIYLSGEDGDIIVVAAGREFKAHRDEPDGRAAHGDAGAVRRRDVRALGAESRSRSAGSLRSRARHEASER